MAAERAAGAKGGGALPERIAPDQPVSRTHVVTDAVLRALAGTGDARLRGISEAITVHLHDFIRETGLTRDELDIGLAFLNAVGQATTATHNEAILLADVFGLTTLACHGEEERAGDEALLGPFWRMHSPVTPNGGSIVRSATPGRPLSVAGRIIDIDGRPVPDVEVDVWQASPCGLYENQDAEQAEMNLRGKFRTDGDGVFAFESVMPAGYPVPTHGPVGRLLERQGRHPFRPAHIHFLAWKPGYRTLITQIFVQDDEHLGSDVVFGVNDNLVGTYERSGDGDGARFSLMRTFTMHAGESRLPHPPID
ncbi:MAG: dioxygenase [Sphingobium sp.]